MYAIKGVYDGKKIRPLEPIVDVSKNTEVIITFLDGVKGHGHKDGVLKLAGIWKGRSSTFVNLLKEIVKERQRFGRRI